MTTTETTAATGFWAVLELMGHVKLAGYITEEEKFGTTLGRIDIPMADGTTTTQYFGNNSVYRITPTTEPIARQMALAHQPCPVSLWELPKLAAAVRGEPRDDDLDEMFR